MRNFTVQIWRVNDNSLVGNGIVISNEGIILTSATVINRALNKGPNGAEEHEVIVHFPQISKGKKDFHANIHSELDNKNNSLVLLKLKEEISASDQVKVALIGTADKSLVSRQTCNVG